MSSFAFNPARHLSSSLAAVANPSLLHSAFPAAVYIVVFGNNRVLDATVVSVHRTFLGAMSSARRFTSNLAPMEEWEVVPVLGRRYTVFHHPQLHQNGMVKKIRVKGEYQTEENDHLAHFFDCERVGAPPPFHGVSMFVVVLGEQTLDGRFDFAVMGVFGTEAEALLLARRFSGPS